VPGITPFKVADFDNCKYYGFVKKTTRYGIEEIYIYFTYYPLSSTHL
jgi:hypothetical protein